MCVVLGSAPFHFRCTVLQNLLESTINNECLTVL